MVALVENMAFVGEFPWHEIGTQLKGNVSVQEMLAASGANFTVKKIPEYITIEGKRISTGRYSLVRSDRSDRTAILGHVTQKWKPCQNETAFQFFHDFVEDGDMTMETAGVLDDGRICWVLAKTKGKFAIKIGRQEDEIDSYLFFANPHIYGKSITIIGTAVRVVCWNTFQLALAMGSKNDMSYSLDHRTQFDPEIAKNALGINTRKMEKFKEAAEFLASKPATHEATVEYMAKVFPLTKSKLKSGEESERLYSRNTELILEEILAGQPGAELGEGTWWANFNAVTYSSDHLIGYNDNTRMTSAFFGDGRKKKETAFNLALEYAKAA